MDIFLEIGWVWIFLLEYCFLNFCVFYNYFDILVLVADPRDDLSGMDVARKVSSPLKPAYVVILAFVQFLAVV